MSVSAHEQDAVLGASEGAGASLVNGLDGEMAIEVSEREEDHGLNAKYVELEHVHSNLPAAAMVYKSVNAKHDGLCKEICDKDNKCEGIQLVPGTDSCRLLAHKDIRQYRSAPSSNSAAVKSAKDVVKQAVAQATKSALAAVKARAAQKRTLARAEEKTDKATTKAQ